MKLYQAIVNNALLGENFRDAKDERQARIDAILPSGSGFDCGTKILNADEKKIVFFTEFHHMNENGYYDGWTKHRITVTPDFISGINIRIYGKNRSQIKEYIHVLFHGLLMSDFDWIKSCEK